ncbi:hypothetical protein BH747_05650 [Enterococcus villorum]|uniref:Uncharacterized protein n=1 Tax=Enterococcus villorum TaxID=112904 RepID=A0A1V8YD43_9ENTE|nr:hypothetical protein [Enterococcus villorum]OQO70509.1 hypothetical protein BH747_05650 [Enterococcus villorum]OQO71838.1 hypothetical protein BH744_13190 [Enterococcus villorum]
MKQEIEKINKQLLLNKIHKKSVGKKQFIQVQQRLHQRKKEIEDQMKKVEVDPRKQKIQKRLLDCQM